MKLDKFKLQNDYPHIFKKDYVVGGVGDGCVGGGDGGSCDGVVVVVVVVV